MPTIEDLRDMQALPLEYKIALTRDRIRDAVQRFGENGVYVSFSGGKDSTVLLDIVRSVYPDIEAVFINTGLEYPEIQQFVKTFDNVRIVRPEMPFIDVIRKYGYPLIGKEVAEKISECRHGSRRAKVSFIKGAKPTRYDYSRYAPLLNVDFMIDSRCCKVMKKKPAKSIKKVDIIATMAEESQLRTAGWLKRGCNAFDCERPISKPMSFWTEQDVLQYIRERNLKICSVYGDIVEENKDGQQVIEGCGNLCTTGCHRTGCIFCAFGAHRPKGMSRFQRLKETHPKQYEFCIGGGEYDSDGLWKPNKDGLGMGHVFDTVNAIYGDDFLPYK